MERMIRRPELTDLLGIGRSTLYEWMNAGRFPPPVKIGRRLIAWPASTVQAWLSALPTSKMEGGAM